MATNDCFSRSVGKSSDTFYEFTCTPCSEDGQNKEAIIHCMDCNSYFCQTCVQYHNKILKSHKMQDKAAMKASLNSVKNIQQNPLADTLPTDTCKEHRAKIIEMYCGQDDIVCCTVCVALYHRNCDGIEYIPNIAKEVLSGQHGKETDTSLRQMQKELRSIKLRRENELTTLQKARDDIVHNIRCFKEFLIEKIEEMAMVSLNEMQAKYKNIAGKIDAEIACLEDMIKTVEESIKDLMKLKCDSNKSQLFVRLKCGEKVVKESNDVLQQLEKSGEKSIKYVIKDDIESTLDCIQTFGNCIVHGPDCCHSVSEVREYSVSVSEDTKICSVYDACTICDDEIVITDNSNKKIKRLDATFNVTDTCNVAGHPWGVCRVSTSQVAVSLDLEQLIQIVTLGNAMVPDRSFEVGANCKGISFLNDEFYVS